MTAGVVLLAQDIITLKTGRELRVRIIDIVADQIRYLDFEELDGDILSLPIDDIYMITYATGRQEYFSSEPPRRPAALPSPGAPTDADDPGQKASSDDHQDLLPEDEIGFQQLDDTAVFKKTARTAYVDLGFQYGGIQALNAGVGLAYNDIMFSVNYGRSQQGYKSTFFRSSTTQTVVFNQLMVGLGYNYVINTKIGNAGVFINPFLQGGVEFADNNRLLNNNSINHIKNYFIRPQLLIGVNIQRFDFFAGTTYSAWLTPGMTDKRYGMVQGTTEKKIYWSEDLFKGREGFAVIVGARIHLFNY